MKKLKYGILFFFLLNFNSIYSSDSNIKASYYKNKVDSLVKLIDTSAKLQLIKSDSVDTNGTSINWVYRYASYDSSNSEKYYYFHTNIDSVIFDSTSFNILYGIKQITKNWIDSDSALYLAELKGGRDFRVLNPNYRISAYLSEPLVPSSQPTWYIKYISNENPDNKKLIIIDATDSIATNIKSLNNNTYAPENFVLYQNYPNPFNPSTVIKYEITKFSKVILRIYNLAGQEIETLTNNYQPKGTYEIKWQANGLSSGIYFCTLQVGKLKKTKKIIYQK